MKKIWRSKLILMIGDIIVLGLVTLVGFASHGTLETSGSRLLTTFVPLVAAWLMVAPFMGCFNFSYVSDFHQLWRPFWAMILAGPMAAFLRSLFLGGAPILPTFVVILGGISALALLVWRLLYAWLVNRKRSENG